MAFNTSPGRAEYTATAGQTLFTFTFKIYTTSNVLVYLTPSGQNPNDTTDILLETTDYTVVINGDNGGDVTLTSGASAGDSITLVRSLPIDRDTEFQANGDFTAATINADQDYQTYLLLDGALDISRSIKVPDTAQGFTTELPPLEPNKMFIVNQTSDGIDLIDPSSSSFFSEAFIVSSMSALLAVDYLTYGSTIVKGYYSQNDGGGGLFNWDSTVDKVTANAGTIIDPSVSLSLQGTGVGLGCWVRQYSGNINVKWFGARGDLYLDGTTINLSPTDDTLAIQAAIDYIGGDAYGSGATLFFPVGIYKITDTINLINKNSIKFLGDGGKPEFDAQGSQIYMYGVSTKPIIKVDWLKASNFEAIGINGSNASGGRSSVGFLVEKGVYASNSGFSFDKCRIAGCQIGVDFGGPLYNNDAQSGSEIMFNDCTFDDNVIGAIIRGASAGSQNVNINFINTHFSGGTDIQKGLWIDGGTAYLFMCTFNAHLATSEYACIYMTGDRSISQPITIESCYTEQTNIFLQTEYTALTTQWYRLGYVTIKDTFAHTNRANGFNNYFIECYKNLDINLIDNAIYNESIYSPPSPTTNNYSSSRNISDSKIRFSGYNVLQPTVTLSRGGWLLGDSSSRVEYTQPSGFLTVDQTVTTDLDVTNIANGMPIITVIVLTSGGANGNFPLNGIIGGKVGERLKLIAQYSYRVFTINNNTASPLGSPIFLSSGTSSSFIITDTDYLIVEKQSDGSWAEVSRVQA